MPCPVSANSMTTFVTVARGTDGENPAANFLHRVHCVADDVEKNLQKLIGVAAHAGQVARAFEFDANIFAQQIEAAQLERTDRIVLMSSNVRSAGSGCAKLISLATSPLVRRA